MTRIGDTIYRGIEFGVHRGKQQNEWHWTYYPKMGTGVATRGKVKGTQEATVAACKAAIDEWLGPKKSN
jgi:hypothetical protein